MIGGRTRSLLIDPTNANIMYAAGVAGGVWKTTNAGNTWTPLTDLLANLAVNSLTMVPTNPNILYAGTGEGYFNNDAVRGAGIFKTINGGTTWTHLASTNNSNFHYVNDIVVSPNNTNRIYAATRTGVWRSTDGGISWTRVHNPGINGGCLDLAIRTDQATDSLFASCGTSVQALVYRNTDAGGTGTWTAVLTESGMGRTSLSIAPSNQNIVYALAASIAPGTFNNGLHAVFRSTSSGAAGTWTVQVRNTNPTKLNTVLLTNPVFAFFTECGFGSSEFFNQGWYDNVIAVDPLDPNRVWAGGIDLFRSDDGGVNWGMASHWWANPGNPHFAHADQHILVFHPQYNGTTNKIMFVGNDGGLFRTNDARAATATGPNAPCNIANGSVAWTELNNNYSVTQFYHGVPYPSGTTYFGGTQDNGAVRGTDTSGADGWSMILGGDGGYVAVDFANTNTLYAENTRLSIQKSTDGGSNFSLATNGITELGSNFLFIAPFVMDPSNSQRLWTGGFFLWRTTSGAASWVQASAVTAGTGSVSTIAVAPTNPNNILAGMSDGFIHRTNIGLTSNSGTNWPFVQPRNGFVSSLTFDPANANIAYATYSTFGGTHIWKSTNAGATWVGIDGSGSVRIPDIPVHSLVVDPADTSTLYVGTDLGVFVSRDGGVTWAVENTGFANIITEALSVGSVGGAPHIFAFTHERGVWRVPTAEAIAALSIFRPSQGRWFVDTNQNGGTDIAVTYGVGSDIPVPGDYDGNGGLFDLAIFRPSQGRWFIDTNRNGVTDLNRQYGAPGDIPVPGDYNGDGRTDFAVFRPSLGRWFIDTNRNGVTDMSVNYGTAGDIPVPADYNGDAITDIAVFRPSQGRWFVDTDRNGTTNLSVAYGANGDIPLPADYNGDGTADFAVFRPSRGRWFLDTNRNGTTDIAVNYGVSTDIPVPGDYNGDFMADIAVFRPSLGRWFLDTNRNGVTDKAVNYGTAGDIPLRVNGWILKAMNILPF